MEELGLFVDNIRFVRQEDCDDGIGRPDCSEDTTVFQDPEDSEKTFELEIEEIIEEFENFLQTSIDLLFNMFQ